MVGPGHQAAGTPRAPADQPRSPKLDEHLEDEQSVADIIEDDEVREALKRLHADLEKAGDRKPA